MNDLTREQMSERSEYVRDLIAKLDGAEQGKAPARLYDRTCSDCDGSFQSKSQKAIRCPPCKKADRVRVAEWADERRKQREQEREQRRSAS